MMSGRYIWSVLFIRFRPIGTYSFTIWHWNKLLSTEWSKAIIVYMKENTQHINLNNLHKHSGEKFPTWQCLNKQKIFYWNSLSDELRLQMCHHALILSCQKKEKKIYSNRHRRWETTGTILQVLIWTDNKTTHFRDRCNLIGKWLRILVRWDGENWTNLIETSLCGVEIRLSRE